MVLTNVLALPNTDNPQLEILGASVPAWAEGVLGRIVFFGWLYSTLVGGVVGLIAVARDDRSLLVWVAQVPAVIIFSFFFGFGYEGPLGAAVPVLVSVFFWTAIPLGIIYLRSQGRSS